jgi:hypothetical protein
MMPAQELAVDPLSLTKEGIVAFLSRGRYTMMAHHGDFDQYQ